MAITKETINAGVAQALEDKGKRKFQQSVDLAVNLQDADFKKPENRINLEIILPHPANQLKVAVFADGQLAVEAKKYADLVITSGELNAYAQDKKKQEQLAGLAVLAMPQLMAQVGKIFGQFLAARGRLPKPILPNANLKDLVENTRRSVVLKSKGKMLPTLHCIVGKEALPTDDITENIITVLDALKKKISEHQISSICIKLTMGRSIRVR
ncbi:MAG: 50S ribosomal protein L1 [Candidatus Micrarchaeota archaeon]